MSYKYENVSVSTMGWDTTYTMTYEIMNQKIIENARYQEKFDNGVALSEILQEALRFEDYNNFELLQKKFTQDSSVRIEGTWGAWQLAKQGGGGLICLHMPIKEGSISFDGETQRLDTGYLTVQVQLSLESKKENVKELLLGGKEKLPVAILDSDFPFIKEGSLLLDLVEPTFKRYLNQEDELQKFHYIFSTININREATEDFAWLTPSDVGYAVAVPVPDSQDTDSLFSVLCMTDNMKKPLHAQYITDASVFQGITESANSVLCISPQKFCEHFLIKASQKMILGTEAADFTYSTNGMEVHNNKDIILKKVELGKGKVVDLKIKANNYSLHLINDYIELQIINASYSETLYTGYVSMEQKIEMDVRKEGKNTIFVPREGDEFKGTIRVSIEPTETAEILKWVGVCIDALAGLLVIAGSAVKGIASIATTATKATVTVTDAVVTAGEVATATAEAVSSIAKGASAARKAMLVGNRLLTAACVVGAVGVPVSLIEPIAIAIGKKEFSKVPSLEAFSEEFLRSIQWTGIEKKELVGARLNDALLLDFKVE